MNDDHPFDGDESRLGTLTHDLPEAKNRDVFRKLPTLPLVPKLAPRPGPARLRVVTAGFAPEPAPAAPRHTGDPWSTLPMARASNPGAGDGDVAVERAFDQLRTQLLKHLRAHALSRIAVASPTSGCGATFAAVNLARSFSAVPGLRTLLLDLNLHRPGIARKLRIDGPDDMRGFLSGRIRVRSHILRLSSTLAAGLASDSSQPAAGLLHSDACAMAIGRMLDDLNPDILLCDLPPVLERDDLSAFLPQVDGVVLVADATRTTPEQISECERLLTGQTRVLGVVLNLARPGWPAPAHA